MDDLTDAVFEEFGRDWVLLERVSDLIADNGLVDFRAYFRGKFGCAALISTWA